MAACKISSLASLCGYLPEGIADVQVLDRDDLQGVRFSNDGAYSNCYVTAIFRNGALISVGTPESARYTSAYSNGVYSHSLEVFAGALRADLLADAHLATRRRYMVLFRTTEGRFFMFGDDPGAAMTHANQTADAAGMSISFSAASSFPLYEVSAAAISGPNYGASAFIPDFTSNTYCINA